MTIIVQQCPDEIPATEKQISRPINYSYRLLIALLLLHQGLNKHPTVNIKGLLCNLFGMTHVLKCVACGGDRNVLRSD